MPVAGELLGGRYRLEDRIASGGMGEVWRAADTVLRRDVAVKTLRAGRSGDPGFEERFRHEARAMAALHHPGIADVYDFGEDDSDAYIVMELVHGTPLNQLIAEKGRLTTDETMSIVAQAGRALEAAHQAGIVHRDVKPGNLIIEPDGTVVLVDFGVARSSESAALTGAKEVVGTALYIAPEQVSKAETGPAADVYALGAVAYHCLAGHPPFEGESPIAVAIQHVQEEPPPLPLDVPDPVRALVARAMAKNPADRFPSAEAMAAEASRMGSGDATTVLMGAVSSADRAVPVGVPVRSDSPPTLPAPPGTPARGHRTLLTVVAVVIGLGVAATLLVWANPGGIFPGGGPGTTPSVATSPAPGKQGAGNGTTATPSRTQRTATTQAPANPVPTTTRSSPPTSPPDSESPSGPPSDSESPSQPPSDEPSEPGDDKGGGGDNGDDDDGGNRGPGGGGSGSGR